MTEPTTCDADCPAKAAVRVSRGDFDLTFCGHHFSRHEPRLLGEGWAVEEEVVSAALESQLA